jgi:hypothetical protein
MVKKRLNPLGQSGKLIFAEAGSGTQEGRDRGAPLL